jgi:hypothetical protein
MSKDEPKSILSVLLYFLAGIIIFLIILGVTLPGCSMIKKYPQDNFVEEIIEEAIEQKTGLDIDLSPYSPELP